MRSKLIKVWEKEEYYKLAERGSRNVRHPAMKLLGKIIRSSLRILDLGCGEGTRLNYLCKNPDSCVGVDISSKAVEIAKKKYARISFLNANLEKLPLKDESFDLVYSAFVLEHLDQPERVINEAVRVLKKGGRMLLVAPNYGSPNRASPPFRGSRLGKLFLGFFDDLTRPFIKLDKLGWEKVRPLANERKYEMDWDTTIEPYLGTLGKYLRPRGLKMEVSSSCWSEEEKGAKIYQRIFRFLGEKGVYPFSYWGPHLLLMARK